MERKPFSVRARFRSATHAWRGIRLFFRRTHNAWGEIFFAALAIYLGCILNVSLTEWALLTLVIGLVFVTEALNTAFEIDIDLTSPEYHPHARDTKDVAAGAALLSIAIAVVVGLIIFLPKMV